jgi:aminopeptidase
MYIPDQKILKKYADVLVKFALWSGEWIKPWEVVYLQVPESAKPILFELQKSILEAGWHYITNFIPEWSQRVFFENASQEQIDFWPKDYFLEIVKTCTHFIRIEATNDKFELKWIDPKKIISRQKWAKFYLNARDEKENNWKLTWTIWLYGTEAMAKDVSMTLEEYWWEIIKACYLNEIDPISKWKEVFANIENIRQKLNNLNIKKVHVTWENIDLNITIWEKRQWLWWSGRNIPSFEIFTSPDWRGTNGKISFNEPLYRYGNLIKWIELEFKDGIIINSKANIGEDLLKEMIATKNADKIGEFSLTDRRFSRITKFMWETLYDENVGWEYGNTHIAIWNAYNDAFSWDVWSQTKEDWDRMWFNDSVIHTDIMSTTPRKVIATLANSEEILIYENWEFKV